MKLISLFLVDTVFAFLLAISVSSYTVNIINNDGTLGVNTNVLQITGYGDPTKLNTTYVRKCKDIRALAGNTNNVYYTVTMGIYKDYIIPRPYYGSILDTCLVLGGTTLGCTFFSNQCQIFMYSPYDPNDFSRFKIENVVLDVIYTVNIMGSSQENITKDGRKTISAWGQSGNPPQLGGCCRATNHTDEEEGWGKPYNITATVLNLNLLYMHTPVLNGSGPSITINSKVTDIFLRSLANEINTTCTWEIKDVATGTSNTPTSVNCVLSTPITAAAVDKNYSVTVNIKPITGSSKVLWNTNETTATSYIVIPASAAVIYTTTTNVAPVSTTTNVAPVSTTNVAPVSTSIPSSGFIGTNGIFGFFHIISVLLVFHIPSILFL